MGEVSNEMLYHELLKLDARLQVFERETQETLAVFRETNRQLSEGQARNDALKRRLFGDRFDRTNVAQ